MKKFISNLTLNQRLAAIVGILGLLALILGNPFNNNKATIDLKELALEVERAEDHIPVEMLADWIIKNNADFKLIDLRTEKEFEEYHIPGALNIPITDLINQPFGKNEKIVLYSQGGIHSAQAWYLMRAKGYRKVYFITGGLEEWKEKVLFPVKPAGNSAEELSKYEKMKEVSKFFGGTPQDSSAVSSSAMPALSMPKISGGAKAAPAGGAKKKKEGC